jgi:hypothetical protein
MIHGCSLTHSNPSWADDNICTCLEQMTTSAHMSWADDNICTHVLSRQQHMHTCLVQMTTSANIFSKMKAWLEKYLKESYSYKLHEQCFFKFVPNYVVRFCGRTVLPKIKIWDTGFEWVKFLRAILVLKFLGRVVGLLEQWVQDCLLVPSFDVIWCFIAMDMVSGYYQVQWMSLCSDMLMWWNEISYYTCTLVP